jgi:hypothetical protein
VTKEQAAREPDWRCQPCAQYAAAFSVRSALLVSSHPGWNARLTHFRAFWLEQERMKTAKASAKAAAVTLAGVGAAKSQVSPASTPRVPAKPAARAQTAYQRKLELVTNALKAQGSTFSLQMSFGSAAADLVCINASLDDTSVDDCAEVLASLLTDVTIGDKSEREQLEQALEDAAEDYEAAAAEAAAKRRVEQLRKELETVEAQAEAARMRRRSFMEEQLEAPPAAGKQPALALPPPQVQQKEAEEEAAAPKRRAAPAPTYQLSDEDEEEEDDDDDGTTAGAAFRMEPVPQQQQQQQQQQLAAAEELRRKRAASKKAKKEAKRARLAAGH